MVVDVVHCCLTSVMQQDWCEVMKVDSMNSDVIQFSKCAEYDDGEISRSHGI